MRSEMKTYKFNKEVYSKIALIKAAYNFTDNAYVHLDMDDTYYYVTIEGKTKEADIDEEQFVNEMLAQSVRHEIYMQTKEIRELMLARALATSVVELENKDEPIFLDEYSEDEILKDWFAKND